MRYRRVIHPRIPARKGQSLHFPPSRVPTETPQLRVRGDRPHKIPTDKTAQSGIVRHGCYHGRISSLQAFTQVRGMAALNARFIPARERAAYNRQVTGSSPVPPTQGQLAVSPLTCINAGREGFSMT